MKHSFLFLAVLALTGCSQEEPRESDYANSTTGMVPGAGAAVVKDLSRAAADDMQSDAQEAAIEASKEVTSVAGDIARQAQQPATTTPANDSR